MPMEQETITLLKGGFSVVMVISVLITVVLWYRFRKGRLTLHFAFIFTLFHFLTLSTAIHSAIQTISYDFLMVEDGMTTIHPMASEEISLKLGATGVIWGTSMVCLLISIILFSLSSKVKY
ncbi:hypothetical protein ACFSCX_13150 [Bacillus salitolerans]|uniref:Uncharacterized protein n=1 Tax=Bacillus salitolerans TaxID=1437434 RepID=A0ABW4LSQ0_9BACI